MTSKFEVAGGQKTHKVPDEASIRKIFEIVSKMPRDQDYAASSFKQMLKDNKINDDQNVLEKIVNFTNLVQESRDRSTKSLWEGMDPDSQFAVFVDVLAKQTAQALVQQQSEETLNFEFAINTDGAFRRGYSLGENFTELEATAAEKLDILFIAWLKNNNFVSKDGFIYKGDGTEIELDAKKNPIPVDTVEFQHKFAPEKFPDLKLDPKEGFAAKAKEAGLNVEVLPRAFPEEKAAPKQS